MFWGNFDSLTARGIVRLYKELIHVGLGSIWQKTKACILSQKEVKINLGEG